MSVLPSFSDATRAVGALTRAATGAARVFTPDASEGQRLAHAAWRAAVAQHGAEFAVAPSGWFDRLVNGMNRLPRPLLAFGTLGLFVYAMVDPVGFAPRMAGLAVVPEPLWWLLGAIVGFYFGARELHHRREARVALPEPVTSGWHASDGAAPVEAERNAALEAWTAER